MTLDVEQAPAARAEGEATGDLRLADLAAIVGGRVEGDGERRLRGVRTLPDAGPEDLAPLFSPGYREAAKASRAGAFLVPEDHAHLTAPRMRDPDAGTASGGGGPRPLLVVAHPPQALALLLRRFHPEERPEPGIHPTAVIGDGCAIEPSAHVGPYAVVGAGSSVGAGAVIGPLAVVGRGCVVGEEARLHPHAVLYDRAVIGPRTVLHAGAVVGSDGFGYATTRQGVHEKVPQVGRAVLGEDVEVGANSTVDRGALGDTVIGPGSKVDNLVQVGHNVRTGRGVLLCGQAGIAGSTVLGDHVVLAGQSGIVDHVEIGDRVQVAAKSAVYNDLPSDTKVGGIPAVELGAWRRQAALQRRLEQMARRLRAVEKALARQEGGAGGASTGRSGHDRSREEEP